MPDKDYLHTNVKFAYVPFMDALRADSFCSDKAINAMSKGLKKDLQKQGDAPIKLITELHTLLESVFKKTPLERQNTNWGRVSQDIDEIVLQNEGKKRTKELIKKSAEKLIIDLKYDKYNQSANLEYQITFGYVKNLFEANCEQCIPLELESDKGYSYPKVKRNLDSLHNTKIELVVYYSKYIMRQRSVDNIRKKPQIKEEINLNQEVGIR